ncbi:sulfite exporter TauE/SafE family protein [Bacillus chungangensis]|uniref:Probable membrane transporter protein n=1 Tax=Bacillus chungangensis TaxID=587633 RepID=A0ABT9WT09_9BACI|nr:sulfite exporter TauE/SafE family protein [Bacillus chungangensis]MDQ0176352.1 putative membrane protein YfcA [Bacillus chungangensis]
MNTVTTIILTLIVIVNGIFAIKFLKDLNKNKQAMRKEPGSNLFLAISSSIIFFFSTFGISDFAISTILYRKKKLVEDTKLPGTLNTQCVIPVAVMALAFISVIKVDMTTLVVCIVAQIIGAYIGPRFVVKLSATVIRRFIGTGLVIATVLILAGKFNLIPSGGTATGLSGGKLIFAAICLFIFGALNNIGIGSYALTMVTIYALGMNPAVAFPIMMGAATFSVPIGSMEFIKFGQYSRKITLFTSTFGLIGVLIGVYLVKGLDVSMLQWVVAAILLYSGVSMLVNEYKSAKGIQAA